MIFKEGLIYRLLPPALWDVAKASGHLPYAPVDDEDGFYHLSTPSQVMETARRYYHAHEKIFGAGIKPETLGEDLKWEPSRGGALFPHYYGFVPTDAVVHLLTLEHRGDGAFEIIESKDLI